MSRTISSTPTDDGFWMPGEFEPHAGCWMLWPERPDNWRLGAQPAQRAFAEVACAIARFEPVTVGVSHSHYAFARGLLPAVVRVVELSHDDAWMRDVGPTVVIDRRGVRRGVDWVFNAWGGIESGLYFPWDRDDGVAQKVLEVEQFDRYRAAMVNEGGAIHTDGQGTLLVTEECLLNRNRNPRMTGALIESTLQQYLGVREVVWLGDGVYRDETNGHIDNLACFVKPGVIALTWTDDRRDPQYDISHDAFARLRKARDARGRKFEIIKLPQPGPLTMTEVEAAGVLKHADSEPRLAGNRLAGSYVNFYIANRGVVMPLLDPKTDRIAAGRLKKAFPGRQVVGVPAREILLGGGNIHCITQQIPAARMVSR